MAIVLATGLTQRGTGSSWDPSQASETFFWADPSRIVGAENDTVSSLVNLANSRGLLGGLAGTNCKLRNIRGVPAVWLEAAQVARLTGLLSAAQAQPVTVFIVATPDTAGSGNILLGGGPGGSTTESRITVTGTTYPRPVTFGAGTALSSGAILHQNQPFLVTVKYAGASNSKIWIEQTLKTTGNGGTAAFEGFTVGNARGLGGAFGGRIGDIVAMLSSSDALIAQTQLHLATKWKTPSAAKCWKVLREGDSTTAGTGGTTGWGGCGYELEQWSRTAPGGAYLDFIGPSTNDSVYSNSNHFGVGGSDTAYHINASTGIDPKFTLGYAPDIINLYIGINDAQQASPAYGDGSNFAANYATLLAKIRTNWPNARVLVSPIHPLNGNGTTLANVADLNSKLAALWATETGRGGKLHQWDAWAAMGSAYNASLMADSLHPNPDGYTVLATARRTAYLSALAALG